MFRFIGYRLFELISCFIIGGVVSVFIGPVVGIVFVLLIPHFVLTEEVQGRIILLVSGIILIYWWYKAFTDKRVEAMGQYKKSEK